MVNSPGDVSDDLSHWENRTLSMKTMKVDRIGHIK
jgi:hypothetical protein